MGIYTILAILMAYSAYRYSMRNGTNRYTWVKLLVTIFLLIFVSFVTKKYYEVPVHVNSVKLANMVDSDTVSGTYEVTITYDYNNSPAMRKSPGYKKEDCGLWLKPSLTFKTNRKKLFSKGYLDDSLKLSLRVKADNTLHEIGVHDFDLDSVEHAIHHEIWTSNRQFLYPYIISKNQVINKLMIDTIPVHYIIKSNEVIEKEIDTFSTRRHLTLSGFKGSGRQHHGCLRNEYNLLEQRNNHYADGTLFGRLDYQYPKAILTGEDISSAIEYFKISFSGIPDSVFHSLKFDYQAPIDVDGLPFEPDSSTMTSIMFNSPEKLAYISKKGMVFHVAFPDMKNTQAVRTFIATGILGWLIGLLFSLLASLLQGTIASLNRIRSWKEFLAKILSMIKQLFVYPFQGFCSLFNKEKDGHRHFYNYVRSHPLIITFLLLMMIAIILMLMIMNLSNVNPFGGMEEEDSTIFNLNKTFH